ncbi:HMG box family protein [Trichomonas vaginalis G3]|uniref:HMG box family protein n=1 Tax=Trichomonas vaginalis (strain ATCC PRA-98 / G3) TaxID=412133 RepID=A2D8Q4_TRIV3|nr:HMG-box family [Trichomonas vaginalis G3]EAY23303.1 HMG box family protein [Trichomonas vaginalis G3]KAI5534044.1 HMG-box family [Trichomonas vaginalis G3]|eukprot:XP_001584289.1 HMG box family protein [Trichomonas vaginalis G3]
MDNGVNKGRKPPNAYILYCNSIREEIKKENPDISTNEMMKLLSDRYKNESPEVLNKFKEIAAKKQEEFAQQCPEYSYKKSTKKKVFHSSITDPVNALNDSFKNNAFTLQCLSNQAISKTEKKE